MAVSVSAHGDDGSGGESGGGEGGSDAPPPQIQHMSALVKSSSS